MGVSDARFSRQTLVTVLGNEGIEMFVMALGISLAVAVIGDDEVWETERKGLDSHKTHTDCLDPEPWETDYLPVIFKLSWHLYEYIFLYHSSWQMQPEVMNENGVNELSAMKNSSNGDESLKREHIGG